MRQFNYVEHKWSNDTRLKFFKSNSTVYVAIYHGKEKPIVMDLGTIRKMNELIAHYNECGYLTIHENMTDALISLGEEKQ